MHFNNLELILILLSLLIYELQDYRLYGVIFLIINILFIIVTIRNIYYGLYEELLNVMIIYHHLYILRMLNIIFILQYINDQLYVS